MPISRGAFYAALRLLLQAVLNRARAQQHQPGLDVLRLLLDLLLDLTTISWLMLLLMEYYPDLNRPPKATTEAASKGLGARGCSPIPAHIWEAIVPPNLMSILSKHVPNGDLAPRPPSAVTQGMLSALKRDGFLVRAPDAAPGPNLSAFVKPKTAEKCALIADLRGLNAVCHERPPPFKLPSAGDVAAVMALHPPAALWACSIDITNFFWSLRLPTTAVGAFRVSDLTYDCTPFGWDRSPALAQATLGHHITMTLDPLRHLWKRHFWTFHYYDDVLIIATSRDLAGRVTSALIDTFRSHGLIISPKSQLDPCQRITWLGKVFDFVTRTVSSTRACLLLTLARSLLAAVVPPHPKLIRRLMGHVLWTSRPRKGATLYTRSWFCHLLRGPRYLQQPTTGMQRGLLDCIALSMLPWQVRDPLPPPLLTPVICMDAAFVEDHYQVGLWSPIFGTRIIRTPDYILTQQQAELFAADAATRLAARLGWSQLTLIGDNRAALYLLDSMRPNLQVDQLVRVLRRIYNRILWTGMRAHLLWVPSHLQPADGPSRASPLDTHQVRDAMRDADRRWDLLMNTPRGWEVHGLLAP